jgi:hypothetical protein
MRSGLKARATAARFITVSRPPFKKINQSTGEVKMFQSGGPAVLTGAGICETYCIKALCGLGFNHTNRQARIAGIGVLL